jgi:hypothetical protein
MQWRRGINCFQVGAGFSRKVELFFPTYVLRSLSAPRISQLCIFMKAMTMHADPSAAVRS